MNRQEWQKLKVGYEALMGCKITVSGNKLRCDFSKPGHQLIITLHPIKAIKNSSVEEVAGKLRWIPYENKEA